MALKVTVNTAGSLSSIGHPVKPATATAAITATINALLTLASKSSCTTCYCNAPFVTLIAPLVVLKAPIEVNAPPVPKVPRWAVPLLNNAVPLPVAVFP